MTKDVLKLIAAWGTGIALVAAVVSETVSCRRRVVPPEVQLQRDPFPSVMISNGLLKARVFLPDASAGYYRGTRFDWSGMVGPVEYAGHHFFSPFRVPHNPSGNDDGIGPAEEFGFDEALGSDEAKNRESFLKIGVGELIKPNDPDYAEYHFYKPFEFADLPAWKAAYGQNWVEFTQNLQNSRGWGYEYVKRISISNDSPILIIEHRLKNTGSKEIDTTWYSHNLINIDGQPVGPQYQVIFPFKPIYTIAPNPVDIEVLENGLAFVRQLPTSYGTSADLSNFTGRADNGATIWNIQTSAGVKIGADQAPVRYQFYAEKNAVCPEIFIRIYVEPGSSQSWETRYEFMIQRSIELRAAP